MFRDDLLRGFLQMARATVIPETRPEEQHFLLRRSGERVNVREALQKSFVVRNGGGDAGLLEHDFRKPDAVGIFRSPPRQVSLELAKPAEQLFAKCCALARCLRIAKMSSSAGARGVSTPALRNCNSELFS